MNDVRILKGYSKAEQKELENAKKHMRCSDLLHDITSFVPDMGFGLIWRKYDKAEPDEQISIIKDIIDFYTDKATFSEPKKYYVHFIKSNRNSYLNITLEDGHRVAELGNNLEFSCWQKTKFTRDEVVVMDPRLVPFMEEVEGY